VENVELYLSKSGDFKEADWRKLSLTFATESRKKPSLQIIELQKISALAASKLLQRRKLKVWLEPKSYPNLYDDVDSKKQEIDNPPQAPDAEMIPPGFTYGPSLIRSLSRESHQIRACLVQH
jgi:hypothetical protein